MSSKSNQWADQVAADANREKERQRAARLDTGLERIKTAFEGRRTLAATPTAYDWKKFTPGRNAYLKPGAMYKTPGNDPKGVPYGFVFDAKSGGLKETKTGKIFKPGSKLNYFEPVGKERINPFLAQEEKYKQASLDLQQPELNKQFGKALGDTRGGFFDAGNFESSARERVEQDLEEQRIVQQAEVIRKADEAVAGLRSTRAAAEQNAIAQLNAAEDPNVAVSAALTARDTLAAAPPAPTALGQVFQTALVGGAAGIQGYQNQQQSNRIRQMVGDSRVVT